MTTTEEYFIALGAKKKQADQISFPAFLEEEDRHYNEYVMPDGMGICVDCTGWPDILDSFTQLKKWVIDPMEAEGYFPEVTNAHGVGWMHKDEPYYDEPGYFTTEKTTNGDIPLAMIKSATRYWESKK